MRPQALFALLAVVLFAWGLIDGLQRSFLGGIYPIGIGLVMLPISLYVLYMTATNRTASVLNYDHEIEGDHVGQPGVPGLWHYIIWLAGFIAGVALVGFWLAIIVFFVAFLRAKSDASWARIATMTAAGVGFITALSWIMVLNFPGGLLQDLYDLPWPLR